jgi:hypothetical protein
MPITNVPLFTPTQIPGCCLWLDAADATTVTTSGSNVTRVTDKSGSNVVLSNATGFSYPNNTFNGSYPSFYNTSGHAQSGSATLGYNSAFAVTTPFTIFVVCVQTSSDYGYLIDSSPSGSGARPYIYSYPFNTGFGGGSGTPAYSNTIVTAEFIAGTSVVFCNGTSLFTGTFGSMTTGGITIGNRFSLNEAWPGHLCEYLIYSTTPSDAQRQQIEGYLAQKWGLKSSLPAGHSGLSTVYYSTAAKTPITQVPYYTNFSPKQISGCKLWLDAQDSSTITTSSGYVASIKDKALGTTFSSTGGAPSNLTVVSKSIGAYQSLYFNNASANNVGLVGDLNQFTVGTAIFVMKYLSTQNGPWRPVFGWNHGGSSQSIAFGTNVNGSGQAGAYVENIGAGTPLATLTNNGLYIVSFTFNGTSTGIGYNGALSLTTGTVSSYGGSSTQLGIGEEDSARQCTNMYLGEILLYNAVLSSTQIQQIESYLGQKWGLTASLPSGHAHFTQPAGLPYPLTSFVKAITGISNIITQGLTNRWIFSEGSGTNVVDSVGGQNVRLYGSPSWTTGNKSGTNAIYLRNTTNGSTTQYGLSSTGGTVVSVFSTTTWTFCMWVYPVSFVLQGADVFFSVCTSTQRYFNFYIGNSSGYVNSYNGYNATGNMTGNANTSNPISMGTWTHLAIVASGGPFTIYFNGVAVGTGTFPSFSISASASLMFGGEFLSSTPSYGVNMYMDDARLYNRALTLTEISQIVSGSG